MTAFHLEGPATTEKLGSKKEIEEKRKTEMTSKMDVPGFEPGTLSCQDPAAQILRASRPV